MKVTSGIVLFLAFIGILMTPAKVMAADPLAEQLIKMDQRAKADLIGFQKDLSSTFGVPVPDVEALFKVLPTPGDVYMTLRISELTGTPTRRVVREFKNNRGKGWGVIAQRMGIKPGSPKFHALKEGRISVAPGSAPNGTPGGKDSYSKPGNGGGNAPGTAGGPDTDKDGGPGMGKGKKK